MTRRDALVVVVLSIAALASVPLAIALDSVVPLFCAWIPQLLILAYLSRRDRAARAATQPAGDGAMEAPGGH